MVGDGTDEKQCALVGDYANVSRWKVQGRLVSSTIDREGKTKAESLPRRRQCWKVLGRPVNSIDTLSEYLPNKYQLIISKI
jgi:hypothetical protein